MFSFYYFGIFILNIIIELIVAHILKFRTKDQRMAVVAVNVITHPILTISIGIVSFISRLFYVAYDLSEMYYSVISYAPVIVMELIVVAVEWKLLEFTFKEKDKKYLKLALAMNCASYIFGILFI